MTSLKKKELDLCENSESEPRNKDEKLMTTDTAKKNSTFRKRGRRKSKKIADSTNLSDDQKSTESKTKAMTNNSQVSRDKFNTKQAKKVKEKPAKKEEIKLRPSEIRYSQSSISNQFTDGTDIGHLLDDIYFGRCFASAIPQIEVSKLKGKWVSADNRRLWVFKQLEVLGRIDFINVKVSKRIYFGKLTSDNGGINVEIRGGNPGGKLFPMICGEKIHEIKYSLKEDYISPSSESSQKSKRRRRRKTKNNKKEKQKEISNQNREKSLNTQVTTITGMMNECQGAAESIENDRNQDLSDEFSHNGFACNDSNDWTDEDTFKAGNYDGTYSVSENKQENPWKECEELLKRIQVEHVFDEYSDRQSLTESYDSDCSESFDPTVYFEELTSDKTFNDFSGKIFENTLEESISYSKITTDGHSAKTEIGNSFSDLVVGYSLNDLLPDDQWNEWNYIPTTQLDFAYGQQRFTDLCGNFKCSRCSRMRFYREIDKGYYYEPPCQYLTAGPRSHQHSGFKNHAENDSVLSKISRGIDKVAGLLKEIFS